MKQARGPSGLGRYGEPGLLVLISLCDGPKHGYAIMTDVEDTAGIRLGPGTLYGALGKLEKLGLVTPVPGTGSRRPYEISSAGRAAVDEQLQMWSGIVETGKRRLGLA